MSRIAILHPQCVRVGGAIQMALQTTRALQQQGHTVTLYTFEKSDECFPDLQAGINIETWHKKTGGKLSNIITLAFHLRQFDIIIANNPPMQIVAALAKVFSRNKVRTLWWHHHVPWYLGPKTKIKSFIERYCIIPFIDQMIATSHFVAEKIQEYCGRGAVLVHPVIQIQSQSPFQGGADEGGGGMHQKSGYGEYNYPANTKLQSFSHQMSREMTRAEQRLWFEVLQSGKTGYKWAKQKIIGNFIVDFYCHEKRLVIEVDGGVHHDQQDYDEARTKYLERLGIRVIRYTNELVLNQIDQVREKILWEMEQMQDPNHQHNLSSPLKGAPDTVPVPLSRGGVANPLRVTEVEVQVEGGEIQDEQGGMQPGNTPVLPMVGHPLERGTGIESAASAPFKGLLTSVERWGMVKGTGSVTLFTHGRLEAGKGIDVLVKTFQKIQSTEYKGQNGGSVQLIIFGTGSMEKSLREQGIDVRPFEGQKTFSELSTGEYGHVIGVYCSSIDAFGMASLESQMAGFPTIIMDRGGAREAILSDDDDQPVGYLVHTEEELSGTISRYVQNKILEKQLSNVNFSHKRDYFSPARLSSDLLSIITKTGQ